MKKKRNTSILDNYYDFLTDNTPKSYEEYKESAAILNKEINTDNVNNIAIVAKYGAGKSSLISTYLNEYRNKKTFGHKLEQMFGQKLVQKKKQYTNSNKNKYVKVSLSTYNDNELDETSIERSILQQLLYSRKKEKFPNSKIERTNRTSIWRVLILSAMLTIMIGAFIMFGLDLSNAISFGAYWVKYILLSVAILTFFINTVLLIYYRKLKRIKYKDLEADLTSKDDVLSVQNKNLINKFIDEVLYFFECTNVDLVIFEDLDRLQSSEIFVKLRELNTIINNSRKKYGKVTFVYAVKDDLFKTEEERAKFFDFILPVIPIINPITTNKIINDRMLKLVEYNQKMKLTSNFIKGISLYIPDMRVLNNSFNDYIIMFRKIIEDEKASNYLESNKLFALCLYKNLFPYDYALLEKNQGLIPKVLNIDELKVKCAENIVKEINDIETRIEKVKKETLNSFEELKMVLETQMRKKTYASSRNGLINISSIQTFEGVTFDNLAHPQYSNYLIQHGEYEKEILDINGVKYVDREKQIKDREQHNLETLQKKLSKMEQEKHIIANYTIKEIVDKYGINFFINKNIVDLYKQEINSSLDKQKNNLFKALERVQEIKKDDLTNIADKFDNFYEEIIPQKQLDLQISYLSFLLINNYIDEHYLEYTSTYQTDALSLSDIKVAQKIQSGKCEFETNIDNVSNLVKWLNDNDFKKESIIIKDILLDIENIRKLSEQEKDGKFSNLIKLLSDTNNINVLIRLDDFIMNTNTDDNKFLLKYLIPQRPTLLAELIDIGDLNYGKIENLLIKTINLIDDYQNVDTAGLIAKYLSNHNEYLNSLHLHVGPVATKKFFYNISPKFNDLSIVNNENEMLDYAIDNNYYDISLRNLRKILIEKYACTERDFYNKNFSLICDSGNQNFIEYINNNINAYIRDILLNPNISLIAEEYNSITTLLKYDKIDFSLKEALIMKMQCKIDNVSEFDENLINSLFESQNVKSTWQNIQYAFEKQGYDCIKKFIVDADVIEGDFGKIEKSNQELLNQILINCSVNEVSKIIEFISEKLNLSQIKIEEIEDEVLAEIIKLQKVNYSNNDFPLLMKYENSLEAYIIVNIDNVLTNFQAFFDLILPTRRQEYTNRGYEMVFRPKENSQFGIAQILKLRNINIRVKQELINKCSNIILIKGYEQIYANYIINERQTVPTCILWQFSDSVELNSCDKIKILLQCFKEIDWAKEKDKFNNYICLLGKDWKNLMEKNEGRVENNEENCNLLSKLKNESIIKSFRRQASQCIVRRG